MQAMSMKFYLQLIFSMSCLSVFLFSTSIEAQTHLPVPDFNRQMIESSAESITVKILLGYDWGSGTLISRHGASYTILTNRHVLVAGNNYQIQIQTNDGNIHLATKLHNNYLYDLDLALLHFSSLNNYEVARFSLEIPDQGSSIFASGYPIRDDPSQPERFVFIDGQIALVLSQSLQGGYKIGCTTAIAKGMSGGPLLNIKGEVIGINGMHQYPLWGNPYVFTDGTIPDSLSRNQMSRYSWAIPIEALSQLDPQSDPSELLIYPLPSLLFDKINEDIKLELFPILTL